MKERHTVLSVPLTRVLDSIWGGGKASLKKLLWVGYSSTGRLALTGEREEQGELLGQREQYCQSYSSRSESKPRGWDLGARGYGSQWAWIAGGSQPIQDHGTGLQVTGLKSDKQREGKIWRSTIRRTILKFTLCEEWMATWMGTTRRLK